MKIGWQKIKGKRYYFGSSANDGKMRSGGKIFVVKKR
jgi:glucan-binding YG repeat protein